LPKIIATPDILGNNSAVITVILSIVENSYAAAILRARAAGLTFGDIADTLGISRPTCMKQARAAINRVDAPKSDHRALALAELDELANHLRPQCEAGDISAIAQATRVIESRRKLLALDSPLTVQLEVTPPPPRQDALYSELRARLAVESAINAQRAIEGAARPSEEIAS
jgi:hypothetical protein